MTPIERTLKELKEANFLVSKVEHFNAHAGCRQDLFGFIDILAVHPRYGTIGVQVCGSDWAPHIEKMTVELRERLLLWLAGGNRCILVGWRKLKREGWQPRVREFSLTDDFPELTAERMEALKSYKNKNDKNAYPDLTKVLCKV